MMDERTKRVPDLEAEISALKERIRELERSEAELRNMENELVVSRDRLARGEIVSCSGHWEFDLASQKVFTSDGARAVYGMADREWTVQEVQTIPLPEYRTMLDDALRALISGGRPYNVEFRIKRPDTGEVVDIRSVAEYERSRNVVFGIIEDITARKQAEDVLRAVEARYRLIFEHAPYGIVIIDPDSLRFVEFNEAVHRQLGYSREEFAGLTVADIEAIETPEETLKHVEGVLHSGRDDFETRHRTKDGAIRNIHVTAQLTEIAGQPVYHCVWSDITARKRAEEEMAGEKSKLRTLTDNVPLGMVLVNREGVFTYINPRFTALFGFDLTDMPDGRTFFRKAFPAPEQRRQAISAWIEDLKDAKPGTQKPRVFTITCKDGATKIVSFSTSVLASGDYLTVCEDITELRHLESQLRQARKMEAIGTLAGGVAHDFNNILTVITGYSTLLKMDMGPNNPLQSYVEQIRSSAEKAAQLTQSLLSFSRREPITLAPLNLDENLRSVEKLLRRLLTENIVIRTRLEAGGAVIMADETQIDQILFNLATNARDAMPEGGTLSIETSEVELDDEFVRLHGYGTRGRYALLIISDTGMGMDEATQERIFDPFFTTKEAGKGTGLGLSSVYGIVKQHSGYITVYSEPGMGTTFRIYLPAVDRVSGEVRRAPAPVEGGSETILVAEDNGPVRDMVCTVLSEYGYATIEAIDGEDAVIRFRETGTIDLLILDSVMPKKNGREAYNEIRRLKPQIKAIFMSGYTRDAILDREIEDRKIAFIPKPISPNALLQKVREVLDDEEPE